MQGLGHHIAPFWPTCQHMSSHMSSVKPSWLSDIPPAGPQKLSTRSRTSLDTPRPVPDTLGCMAPKTSRSGHRHPKTPWATLAREFNGRPISARYSNPEALAGVLGARRDLARAHFFVAGHGQGIFLIIRRISDIWPLLRCHMWKPGTQHVTNVETGHPTCGHCRANPTLEAWGASGEIDYSSDIRSQLKK